MTSKTAGSRMGSPLGFRQVVALMTSKTAGSRMGAPLGFRQVVALMTPKTAGSRMGLTGMLLGLGLLMSAVASAASRNLPDFIEIVEENKPAVVKIISEQVNSAASRQPRQAPPPGDIPEMFRRFFEFGDPFAPPGQGQMPRRERRREALGSGFIISEDGYVLTNHHVVRGADRILVRLLDRREFEAELVGEDARSDLALLKVDAKNLPKVTFGEPGKLQIGEWVVAIGSPFGLDYSVTSGIVSAKGRSLPTEDNANYVPFIQTDVAINPGNSGGPLLNLQGEVVGINAQIFTRSGGSIGLSFAIPISVASNVIAQLKEKGYVERGWLGVVIQEVNQELAATFGLERSQGALIAEVLPDGPADKAGLQPGDLVLYLNGQPIEVSSDLPHIVGLMEPETDAWMVLIRDGKRQRLQVRLGSLGGKDGDASVATGGARGSGGRLGLVVGELDERTRQRLNIASGAVIIREIIANSPASTAGLRPGLIITHVNDTQVDSVKDFQSLVRELEAGKYVRLRVVTNDGRPAFLALPVDP